MSEEYRDNKATDPIIEHAYAVAKTVRDLKQRPRMPDFDNLETFLKISEIVAALRYPGTKEPDDEFRDNYNPPLYYRG